MIFSEQVAQKNFVSFPFVFLAIGMSGGILPSKFCTVPLFVNALFCLAATGGAIAFLLRRQTKISTIFTILAFFFIGNFLAETEKLSLTANRIARIYDEKRIASGEPVTLQGILVYEPEMSVGGYFLTLHVEDVRYKDTNQKASGNVKLFVVLADGESEADYKNLQLRYGAEIRVAVRLQREEKFRNPGVVSVKEILAQKDLDANGTVKSPLLIERLEDKRIFLPLAWLYDWRQIAVEKIKRKFSIETAGVLIASLLGNRYFLTKNTADSFREGGTFHVLVISGLHITFIGIWTLFLMRKLTKNRFAQFAVSVAVLWAYSLAVGAEVPVLRAALMFTVFQAATLFYRQGNSLNALGATAIALLVWRPDDLFDQSFQLTFVSVTAIFAFAFPLLEKLRAIGAWKPAAQTPIPPDCAKWLKILCETLFWSERNWRIEQKRTTWQAKLFKSATAKIMENWNLQTIWRYFFGSILVSAVVTIFLVPFLILYFHRLSLVSLLMNVFVGAVIALESLTAIFALFVGEISPILAQPLVGLSEILNWLMTRAVEPFNYFGWTSLRVANYDNFGQIVYWVYFAPLILLIIVVNRWNPFENAKLKVQNAKFFLVPLIFTFLIFNFALIVFHPNSEPPANGRLTVEFLDVGQGDAALVTFPNGATLLIDGGGKPGFGKLSVQNEAGEIEPFAPDLRSIGESVVCQFLWEKGLRKVDYILATHADTDHIDGLNDVARNFAVEKAFVGRADFKDEDFNKFSETLTKRKIPLEILAKGESFTIGGTTIEVINPLPETSDDKFSVNNNGIVLQISYGKRTFLLTADIEKETENALLAAGENLNADVVKVGHHGSHTSSTESLVKATNARIAVISVGLSSPFGHPHREIVERWKNAGSRVLTTGENGTISISTDGEDLKIETFVKK